MRTYIRLYNENNEPRWAVVQTDANGFDDYVWASTLVQCFKLNINESPFYANYGIPSLQAVNAQVPPDSYLSNLQSLFAGHFANLVISRTADNPPTYLANLVTQQGVLLVLDQIDNERYGQFAITENGQPGVTEDGTQVIVG
jgi:hypothetical protein